MSDKNREHHKEAGKDSRDRSRSPQRKDEKKIEPKSLDAKRRLKTIGIQMKLSAQKPTTKQPKLTIASAFNQDSDEEPEEMPPEARMRMRNIGRDTPTSSGPNSFGKTKQGFSDPKKLFDKNVEVDEPPTN